MKNTLAQIHLQLNKIDPRLIQLAFAAFALVAMIAQSPMDGPGGTR